MQAGHTLTPLTQNYALRSTYFQQQESAAMDVYLFTRVSAESLLTSQNHITAKTDILMRSRGLRHGKRN